MVGRMSAASVNVQNGKIPPALPAHMENKNLGPGRRSTPDSDALVSSDDDHEHNPAMSMSLHSVNSLPAHRPARRSSWLSEVQPSTQRKFSLGGMSFASGGSQPPTPSGESGGWDNPNNPSRNFPWNSQLWQKDRPTRISEVMPSPTATFHDDMRSPNASQQAAMPGGLPFEIPLEPNRKIVRSQSYSAGQLEKSPGLESPSAVPGHRMTKRGPLLRRTSRPSVLGMDGSGDYNLDSLQEDEVDEEDEGTGVRLFEYTSPTALKGPESLAPSTIAKTTNSPSKSSHSLPPNIATSNQTSVYSLPRTSPSIPLNPPDSDYAVEDEDIVDSAFGSNRFGNRSASQMNVPTTPTADNNLSRAAAIESRRLEGVRRSQWQSSLGFGIPEEGSQSRRHSFATELVSRPRNPSLNQAFAGQASPFGHQFSDEAFQRGQGADEPAAYFAGSETKARHNIDNIPDEFNPFAVPNVFTRPVRILYIVSFKCSRADIYYIPDNTGLQVQPGDMAIVEGDRGQDLGTVQRANVTLEEAKQLKQDFTKKHFQSLMMFSRLFPHVATAAANGEMPYHTATVSPTATQSGGPGKPGSASETEPRPKMIKRVAKPDEIHLLREKEGNEAKAKRVCQSKVNEHGLRMEILDAEFQHDYRKLTFFYFAEEYINFNELVTDLFKVYKTRIWMSAINPASFPAPTAAPRGSMERRAANRAHDDYRLAVERGNAMAVANAMASGASMTTNAAPGLMSPNSMNGSGMTGNEYGGNRMGGMEQGIMGGNIGGGYGGSPPLSRAAASGYHANVGGSSGPVAPPTGALGSEDFTHSQAQSSFDNRGLGGQMTAAAAYSPYGGQQFGQTIPSSPWGQAGISTAIPYQFYPESRDMAGSAFAMGVPGPISLAGNVPRSGFGNPQQGRTSTSPPSAAENIQRQFQSLSLDSRRAA